MVYDEIGEWDLDHTKNNTVSFYNLNKKHLEKFNKGSHHKFHPLLNTLVVKGLQHVYDVFEISIELLSPQKFEDWYDEVEGMNNVTLLYMSFHWLCKSEF